MPNLSPSEKKTFDFVTAIVQKELAEVEPSTGFSGNIFMMFGLPTRKLPQEQKSWIKENPKYTLTITQVDPVHDIPYGCYARINQIFLDTEVKTKATNVIDLGNSFTQYVRKVGYEKGRANRGLKRQLANLIRCAIHITAKNLHGDAAFQTLVGRKWFIGLDERSPDEPELFRSRILLDKAYATYIFDHAVPLDLKVVRYFKRNPLALDFYRFLAYRIHGLSNPLKIDDPVLFDQFGGDIANPRITRLRLQKILRKIQTYWKVTASFQEGYFYLAPSPPAVDSTVPLRKSLRLVDNLWDN